MFNWDRLKEGFLLGIACGAIVLFAIAESGRAEELQTQGWLSCGNAASAGGADCAWSVPRRHDRKIQLLPRARRPRQAAGRSAAVATDPVRVRKGRKPSRKIAEDPQEAQLLREEQIGC